MATRPQLDPSRVSRAALSTMEGFHADTLREVEAAVGAHDVVVVGMAQNPFVKKARRYLQEGDVKFHYLEYGSYLSEWKRRLAIKMWSGWPTFPQVFVKGELVGGAEETKALLESGELKKKLGGS